MNLEITEEELKFLKKLTMIGEEHLGKLVKGAEAALTLADILMSMDKGETAKTFDDAGIRIQDMKDKRDGLKRESLMMEGFKKKIDALAGELSMEDILDYSVTN